MARAAESSGLERAIAERRQRAEAVEKKQAQLKVCEAAEGVGRGLSVDGTEGRCGGPSFTGLLGL